MTFLEWVLIVELGILACAVLFFMIGWLVARATPNDPMFKVTRNFWRAMLARPKKLREQGRLINAETQAESAAAPVHIRNLDLIEFFASEDEFSGKGWEEGRLDRLEEVIEDPRMRWGLIYVRVIPDKPETRIVGHGPQGLKVEVSSPNETAKANKLLIELLAQKLEIKPFQIVLVKGHFRARKIVRVTGMDQKQLDAKVAKIV